MFKSSKEMFEASSRDVKNWLDGLSDGTRKVYERGLFVFYQLTGKTPDEILEEREKELEKKLRKSEEKLRLLVMQKTKELQEKGHWGKAKNTNTAVRSLLTGIIGKRSMLDLPMVQVKRRYKDWIPQRQHLQTMFEVADLDERIRLLFLSNTGMRVGDAIKVSWGSIEAELADFEENPTRPVVLEYTPEKRIGGEACQPGKDFSGH